MHSGPTRIQLTGKLAVELAGRRVEHDLPGRQGRLLFTYLTVNRSRPVTRDSLMEAIWPYATPPEVEVTLRALTSRLRRVLGSFLEGRGGVQLVLPAGAWVDLEAVTASVHRAESAVERSAWHDAWAPAHIALNISRRPLLPGFDAPWLDDLRRGLEDIRLRALACWVAAGLGIGGPELADAEAAARKLISEAPLRETGYLLLMRVLGARGNAAEAVQVYEQLRARLDDELGMTPGVAARDLHRRLLAGTAD